MYRMYNLLVFFAGVYNKEMFILYNEIGNLCVYCIIVYKKKIFRNSLNIYIIKWMNKKMRKFKRNIILMKIF